MKIEGCAELIFQHLIDFPKTECVFCSTKEKSSGKTRLFLIFSDRQRVYKRDGVHDTWEKIDNEEVCQKVQAGLDQAIMERKIPCFCAN